MFPFKNLLFFLVLLVYIKGHSQLIPETFQKTVDSVISIQPQTYLDLEHILGSHQKDTILMRYLANTAAKKKYLIGQAYALNHLGRRYRNLSEYSKALVLHKEALEVATEANSLEFKVYSLNMQSVVFRRTDAIKSALDYSQEALELAESVKEPSVGIRRSINVSLNNIGNIYRTLEQYDLAIENFQRSLELDEELGNKLGLAINHQNIGECYEAQGKLEEALMHHRTSLAYNEEIDSDRGRIICKYSIAHIYVHEGNPQKGLDLLEPLLPGAKKLGDIEILTALQINIGWTLIYLDRHEEAKTYLLRSIALAHKHNIPSALSEANAYLSSLWIELGDFEKGLNYFKIYKQYDEQISNDRNLRYVTDVITRYDSEKKSSQIQLLAQENELVKLELKKNKTVLLISGIALALLAGIFYILYRQYQLNNEKKVLTLEQSMLRSQMNPHFLFNSLNSIKLYIINNEQKNAVYYLNKFSKLIRKILESSSLKEIPLAEELETVELYMNIENIRFSNEINFVITIDEAVDPHLIKIPSMILQPFLENALWHGLSSKDGEKNIILVVTKEENEYINISITDNGIGREAAEKLKESKVLKRKSVGIDITKERLANFSRDYQNSFNVEMIDLYDDDGIASGTKVVLHLPTV
ncbi:tetratricopeptide repeat-containing sensor histidine kinase [Aurantibacter crassamenti]|uniref:tetratricopeptide repeat-containing sensor histidine kinase n=1 Tax=Aurantibacter crassamenti TaxID=1837375 RepID=UPI001EED64A5|nr:tetratricopeptide repeat protein [Aurantibacter crassamenti]